jgi:Putative zinc-finger
MDHEDAVRQKATEKYLLDELDPALRDQFEEHLFDCQDCALDVRAAAMFVEQTKVVLAEPPAMVPVPAPAPKPGWFAWFRPAFAVPVLALLLAVMGYQNFVSYPQMLRAANEPKVGPWSSVNVSTRASAGAVIKVTVTSGQGFILLLNIPPDQTYSAYTFELNNPAGKLQWSDKVPAASPDDARSIYVPGAGLEQGRYTLKVTGLAATGESSNIGSYPIEVQIQR